MKSLFKRTVAAASSSVLVLSQLATIAANVNVSAAETAPLTVDKKFVLDVPVDEADPLKAGQVSDWGNKAETMLLAMGEKTVTIDTKKAKNTARTSANKAAAKYGHISSAEIDEILAGVADTATVEFDGMFGFKVTVDCANIGKTIAQIAEDEFLNFDTELDWSKYNVSGSLIIEGLIDGAKKSVSYEAYIIDETGAAQKGDKSIEAYANKKIDEIMNTVAAQADKIAADAVAKDANKSADTEAELAKKKQETIDDLAKARKKVSDKLSSLRAFADAVVAINITGTEPNTVYTDYLAEVGKKSARAASIIADKAPESITAALADKTFNEYYDIFVENANTILDGAATIEITTADIASIINEGYDFDIQIKEGPSGEISFKIADDQADELLAAVKALNEDPKKYADAGYTVVLEDGSIPSFTDEVKYEYVAIDSEKKVSAKGTSEYGIKGNGSYDVERIIKKIVVKEAAETTTTTTTTTSEPVTDDTTTTTTTSEPVSDDTTTTTTTSEPVSDDTTTTTTTTEPVSDDTTTTTTTTEPVSDDTTTTTTTTEPVSDDTTTTTTTTEPVTDDTTTTTTTTEPITDTTTTTTNTAVSFEIKGISDSGLVYWSEETGSFDLSALSITMHILDGGVDTGKTVDVTNVFQPDATSPKDLTLGDDLGIAAIPVKFVLKNTADLEKAVADAGFDNSVFGDEKLTEGYSAGQFIVYLVLRGDADLNGVVSVEDAQYALDYYTETMVSKRTAKEVLTGDFTYLVNKGDKKEAYFPYSHYASDVTCEAQNKNAEVVTNDGLVTVEDAQMILTYYTEIVVGMKDGLDWNSPEIIGVDINVKDELHAQPCVLDENATDYTTLDKTVAE